MHYINLQFSSFFGLGIRGVHVNSSTVDGGVLVKQVPYKIEGWFIRARLIGIHSLQEIGILDANFKIESSKNDHFHVIITYLGISRLVGWHMDLNCRYFFCIVLVEWMTAARYMWRRQSQMCCDALCFRLIESNLLFTLTCWITFAFKHLCVWTQIFCVV